MCATAFAKKGDRLCLILVSAKLNGATRVALLCRLSDCIPEAADWPAVCKRSLKLHRTAACHDSFSPPKAKPDVYGQGPLLHKTSVCRVKPVLRFPCPLLCESPVCLAGIIPGIIPLSKASS